MEFLKQIKLIQGGMGVYVSNWRLAKSVAMEKPGITAGTVSGTALDIVYVRLLQLGDPGGHILRAFTAFDDQFGVEIGKKVHSRYFIAGGKKPNELFQYGPKPTVRFMDKSHEISAQINNSEPTLLTLDEELIELLMLSNFAEVWLAKEDHKGKIFINYLKKIELPLIFALYGAMLAGVDGVVVGAGNPDGLPALCSDLAKHAPVITDLSVLYRESGEKFILSFNPGSIAQGRFTLKPLIRPAFLAIVSSENLVDALAHSSSQPPDGFIIEHHTAGGHNAPPQGPAKNDSSGQLLYSESDEPDLEAIRRQELPFWLAGGYNSHTKFEMALKAGATGVQIGSTFALAEESGLSPAYRNALFTEFKNGRSNEALVRTSSFSPTGFPFKVAQLNGTLSDEDVYTARRRNCDLGLLKQIGLSKPDEKGMRHLFQRCAAAPVEDFINKRGLIHNSEGKRCLCNGLIAGVGLGQIGKQPGEQSEEPAIVTFGNNLDGICKLSQQGQIVYSARNVIEDILGLSV
ncbi:MAG: 2-nitropropane dioxygenase [Anaerolinea sp.]|nr:2-nitropropane dioxygenase [Anaerolinea sp.]